MDAPVSGGEPGAIEGTLSIMVGADGADFDAVKPILDTVGTTVVLVGPPGSGQTVKAANQLIVAGTLELVAEAIVFLRAYGVDTEAAVSVLSGGLAGSRVLERKAASMLAGNFEPGFRIDLHHKDMGIVTAAARERDVVIPLGALTAPVCTNIGNPHATFFVADVEAIDLAALGPILEHDPLFPQRANIGVRDV